MLLKSGADSNLEMEDGRTPIHIAAEVILRKYWLSFLKTHHNIAIAGWKHWCDKTASRERSRYSRH